jgi:hypothetical protein
MKPTVLAASALALLAVALAPRDARADAGPHFNTGVFFPVGVNVGYSANPGQPNGFVFGGEASVVYFDRGLVWFGAYGDALRDFGKDETRFSVGPEIGLGPLGFDGGYLAAVKNGGHSGWVGRALLTVSLVGIYGRVGHIADGDQTYGEIGALFKIPIPVWSEPNERLQPQPIVPETPKPVEPTPSGPIAPDEPQGPFAPPPPSTPPPSSPEPVSPPEAP